MSLIKRSNEIVIPQNVKMMIYGQAGMGKTTLALSAPKPLLLDFDNGVKRVNNAHLDDSIGIVQVNNWQEILTLTTTERASLAEFDTIVAVGGVESDGTHLHAVDALHFKIAQQVKLGDDVVIVLLT